MIHKNRLHSHLAERKRHFAQPTDVDLPGELAHRYREERRPHRLGHNLTEGGPGPVETEDPNLIVRIVRGLEKREALDVVPMRVSDQHREVDRARLEFFLQRHTKWPDAGT